MPNVKPPEFNTVLFNRPLCICLDRHEKKCKVIECCFSCPKCGEERDFEEGRPQPCKHCVPGKEAV